MSMRKSSALIGCFLLVTLWTFGQLNEKKKFSFKGLKKDVTVKKYGPYFGYQKGKYDVYELGMEKQWKRIKLSKPSTNALHFGINYNFVGGVLGYDLGYWHKKGRLNFTYGGNLCLRTDFTHNKVGFAPVIGYKIWQFHLQTGYVFLTKSNTFMPTNTFFISLCFVLLNHRDVDVK